MRGEGVSECSGFPIFIFFRHHVESNNTLMTRNFIDFDIRQ